MGEKKLFQLQYLSLMFYCVFIRIQLSCVFSLGFLPVSTYGSAALCCLTHCYYHWHCELVCQTQTASSPWCWFRGRCRCCWKRARILCWSQGIYTANTQSGSYHNHIKAVSLHSTSETWVIKENRLGAYRRTHTHFSPFISTQNNFFKEIINHGYGNFYEAWLDLLPNISSVFI